MVQLQTNIDDMNPQLYADVSEKLFDAGAADVWFTPIQMKKNRPGVMLSVLGTIANEQPLANIILRETTTLGVRVQPLATATKPSAKFNPCRPRTASFASRSSISTAPPSASCPNTKIAKPWLQKQMSPCAWCGKPASPPHRRF